MNPSTILQYSLIPFQVTQDKTNTTGIEAQSEIHIVKQKLQIKLPPKMYYQTHIHPF